MSLSTHGIFESLVIMHIITGTVGLISVWIPIAGKKGGVLHRQAHAFTVAGWFARRRCPMNARLRL